MDSQTFFVVMSSCVQRGYPHDPLSVAREMTSFSAHSTLDEAGRILLDQLWADMTEDALRTLRHSVLVQADVPLGMMAAGCPARWIEDRQAHLLRTAGVRPGEWAHAVQTGTPEEFLMEGLRDAASILEDTLAEPSSPVEHLAAALMQAAGAALRAQLHDLANPQTSGDVLTIVHAVRKVNAASADALSLMAELAHNLLGLLEDRGHPSSTREDELSTQAMPWMPDRHAFKDMVLRVRAECGED
jgi:hypothetical protein